MGVMTLPLMILVDQKGNVVSDNIYVDGLELGAAAAVGCDRCGGELACYGSER